jgi:hypothetical protein
MYVWYLPEFLLMIAEEDVVNKLVKTRRLIQEQEILVSLPTNKQTNELRIKKYIRTHIAEMNIFIDNKL